MKIDKNFKIELYKTMEKIRWFEKVAQDNFLKGVVPGFLHLYIGQEAIAAGVCANLTKHDQICTTHRGHGHCLAKGMEMSYLMAELFGKATGCSKGKGGSMHTADKELGILAANGIVGASIPIATGAAFAMKYNNTKDVVVCFFGDGASNRGTFHEAINMASNWKLPIIYACENNGVGQFTRQELHQNIKDISVRVTGYNITGMTVDGNDVLQVYKAAHKAVQQCREGEGPVLIEFKTWRQSGHYIGDPESYRTDEEKEYWKAKDPILCYKEYLIKNKFATVTELDSIEENMKTEAEKAVQFALNSPYPSLDELTTDCYVE